MIKSTTDKIFDNTDKILQQLKEGLYKIANIGKATKDKFTNYVKDIFDVLPILEKAGFVANSLVVGISIPPSVEIHFSQFKALNLEQIKDLETKHDNKKMFKLILKALLMSRTFHSKISPTNFNANDICIEISIPPKVSIKYVNKNIANNFIMINE